MQIDSDSDKQIALKKRIFKSKKIVKLKKK